MISTSRNKIYYVNNGVVSFQSICLFSVHICCQMPNLDTLLSNPTTRHPIFQWYYELRNHIGWSSKENNEQHSDYESTNVTFTWHWHPSVIDISPLWGRWQTWENRASLPSTWSAPGRRIIFWALPADNRRLTRSTYRLELLSATRKLLKKGKMDPPMAAMKAVTINKVLPETPTNTLNSLTSFLSNGLFKMYIRDFKKKERIYLSDLKNHDIIVKIYKIFSSNHWFQVFSFFKSNQLCFFFI